MERHKGRLEFSVGVFMIIGLLCLAYLSVSLGKIGLGRTRYEVHAVFSTVSGLRNQAQIMMAGVDIGEVHKIQLKDGRAEVIMGINKDVKLEEDSVASIKTMGIIGEKYVSISPGASEKYLEPGGVIRETQAPIDIEGLISKFAFGSIDSKKSEQ